MEEDSGDGIMEEESGGELFLDPRRLPEGSQDVPRKLQGGTQGTQEAPGSSRRSWKQKVIKNIMFYSI